MLVSSCFTFSLEVRTPHCSIESKGAAQGVHPSCNFASRIVSMSNDSVEITHVRQNEIVLVANWLRNGENVGFRECTLERGAAMFAPDF